MSDVISSTPLPQTCILVPTCLAYSAAARISLRLLDKYWPSHPPIFLCGLDEEEYAGAGLIASLIPRREDPSDWIGIALRAVKYLQACGYRRVVLILDDQGPLDVCHARHLDVTIHEWMSELDAVYIRLQGWEHRRPAGGWSLGAEYLHLQKQDARFPWRYALQPALWDLEVLAGLLEVVHARAKAEDRTAWFFEVSAGQLGNEVPGKWNENTYRICGREMALKPVRGVRRFFLDLRDRAIRTLHERSKQPGMEGFAPVIVRAIRPHDCYYTGPYPFHFAGFINRGRLIPNVARILKKRGEHVLVRDMEKAAPISDQGRNTEFQKNSPGDIPHIIWCLWLQGWDAAPEVARACLASWRRLNPGWCIHALDERALADFLPPADLHRILARHKESEALSDQIRVELLARYGGVWADATTLCTRPLETWLPQCMNEGFFAFDRPAPERMVASWFLASEKGNYIIEKWRDRVVQYWAAHEQRDQYFWFHQLFNGLYEDDPVFKRMWDEVPKLPASHPYHFSPEATRLIEKPTRQDHEALLNPPSPVFKLTHKAPPCGSQETLLDALIAFGRGKDEKMHSGGTGAQARRRVLVTWYGSFPGHGTIGDLRSLESVVTHLVGSGHCVAHATASAVEITGAQRVDWHEVDAEQFDGILFVCGPILSFHPETNALFEKFKKGRLMGLGVSLLPEGHPHRADPFETVLARQGGPTRFGDVAIAAPLEPGAPRVHDGIPVIGIALRGMQIDYGEELCRWQETERIVKDIVKRVSGRSRTRIVSLENHLSRAGISPDEIERSYAQCDLVITSRFHGAVMAMRHGVPFIAIDQIEGGAKVHELLADAGWPHVYKIGEIGASQLASIAKKLLAGTGADALARARNHAVADANRTLAHLDAWLTSLPAGSR